ncbi:MAG: hypothetical protein AAFR56_22190, partial [Chloroflexota bacterium]
MSKYLDAFTDALRNRRKVKVIIKRKGKPTPLIATCAPLDHDVRGGVPMFHFYKFAWKHHRAHIVSIEAENLTRLETLDESFDPADFIDWDVKQKPWVVARNYS